MLRKYDRGIYFWTSCTENVIGVCNFEWYEMQRGVVGGVLKEMQNGVNQKML